MQIGLIETFLDLMETRNFNRTAERMGVTQSTVSHRVKSLETEFGKRLFSRNKGGTAPTSAGLRFHDHARALQRQWHEAARAVESAGAFEHSIRIGVQQDVAEQLAGPWLSKIHQELPTTSIYMEVDYSTQMNRDLASGELDLAVLYTPHFLPDLHYEKIGEITYQLVSTLSPFAADLRLETYRSTHYSPAFERTHRIALPHLVGATLSTGQNVAMTSLLKSMGGAAFVTDVTARELADNGIAQIVVDVAPIPQPVYAATNIRTRHAHQHRRIIDAVSQLLQ
ncbi:LysR family transcriptional regulator [Agrobacterium sp. ES01]|uniref:LysR family transcriptional regulator n=1 Tax=Agrobacterium sp. ES01 TaxID=3420714 RepID=UPI003D0AA03C